jgi:hypothetical protein
MGIGVKVHAVGCKKARFVEGAFINRDLFRKARQGKNAYVFTSRSNQAKGWTCWARVNQGNGIVKNVCWRKHQVLLFRWAG